MSKGDSLGGEAPIKSSDEIQALIESLKKLKHNGKVFAENMETFRRARRANYSFSDGAVIVPSRRQNKKRSRSASKKRRESPSTNSDSLMTSLADTMKSGWNKFKQAVLREETIDKSDVVQENHEDKEMVAVSEHYVYVD